MSTKTFKKGVLASSIAMILAGVSSQAIAAEEAASKINKEEVEVIQVTGIRGSMKASINSKRFANSVVDVITSEDIGKFPDKNVAESLSRITGVAVSREFGEGEKISIRGTGPKYNRTLMNGQSVASADWFILDEANRSFNYTLLPSVIVKGLEVYKSPTADLDEGSIGGTVILRTNRPLDLDANTVSASVQAQYSEKSGDTDPLVDAMYSWKNENETFGILVSAVTQKRTLERQGVEVLGYAGSADDDYIVPKAMGAPIFKQDRERTTFFTSLQYAPTDSLLFTLNAMTSEMDSNNQNSNLLAFLGRAKPDGTNPNREALIAEAVANGKIGAGNTVLASTDFSEGATYNYINRISATETEQFHLDVDYEAELFTVNFEVGTTAAEGGTTRETSWEYGTAKNGVDFDITGGGNVDFAGITNGNDAAKFGSGWIWGGEKPTTDKEDFAQLDFDIPVDLGIISSIKTGVKYRSAERTQDRAVYGWHNGYTPDGTANQNYMSDDVFTECPTLADCGLNALGSVETDSSMTGNITTQIAHNRAAMEQIAFGGLPSGTAATHGVHKELTATWATAEDSIAIYVDASFEGDNYRGNFGVRYVQTDQSSSGYNTNGGSAHTTINAPSPELRAWINDDAIWQTVDNDYSEFLPSFNLTYDLSSEQLVRFAASRVMARQNWADISAGQSQSDLNVTGPTGAKGNPLLDPTIANQFDVSYEWYYSDASMLSAAIFYKDFESLTTVSDVVEPVWNNKTNAFVDVTFKKPVNGPGGSVTGLELGLQHDFGGFGVQANYTYTDASSDQVRDDAVNGSGLIEGTSEHMANLVGYYENESFGARLMYNYRSEWYKGINGSGVENYNESFGQLDASFSYIASENVTLTLEGVNLSDTEIREYNIHESRINSIYANGRRFVAGVRINF